MAKDIEPSKVCLDKFDADIIFYWKSWLYKREGGEIKIYINKRSRSDDQSLWGDIPKGKIPPVNAKVEVFGLVYKKD